MRLVLIRNPKKRLSRAKSRPFMNTQDCAKVFRYFVKAMSPSIGNWTGTVNLGQTITLPSTPVGTIFVAYLTDNATGNLALDTPRGYTFLINQSRWGRFAKSNSPQALRAPRLG